jgi:hypothetical protein
MKTDSVADPEAHIQTSIAISIAREDMDQIVPADADDFHQMLEAAHGHLVDRGMIFTEGRMRALLLGRVPQMLA